MIKFWTKYGHDKVTVEQDGNALRVVRYANDERLYTAAIYHVSQPLQAITFACTLMLGLKGAF